MTLILRINEMKLDEIIGKAADGLKEGKTLVYPTETSYGLGAAIGQREAVEKIREIKKRRSGKPFLVIVSDLEMAGRYAYLNKDAMKLIGGFMPGRLSIVIKCRKEMPEWVCRGSIGFRISSHEIPHGICGKMNEPIVTTSANLYGSDPCYSGDCAIEVFDGIADMIIDAGRLPFRPPTTVFDVQSRRIVREGGVGMEEIMKCLEPEHCGKIKKAKAASEA